MATFYTYAHVDNNDQIFYIGSGDKYRPHNFSVRSEEWFNYRKEHGLSEVIIFGEFETKDDALEDEKQFTLKMIELDQPLVNKKIGNEWRCKEDVPTFGKTGELGRNFKGIVVGINSDNEVIVFNGAQDIDSRPTRTGKYFNNRNVSSVITGSKKSHHGFKFTRTKSTDILREYLNSKFYDPESKIVLETYLSSVEASTS